MRYGSAVAAATGRGFKSHQPDLIIGNPKHEFRNPKLTGV